MHRAIRILLVDGDVPLRLMLRSVLEHEGYDVALSYGGADARREMDAGEIRFLIVDNGFHSAAGLELADYASTLGIPVMLMAEQRGGDEMLARGPHPYIVKPFRTREFADKVRAVLAAANAEGRGLHGVTPAAG